MINTFLQHHQRREHNEMILGGGIREISFDVAIPKIEPSKPNEKPLMKVIDELLNDIEKFPTKDPYKDKTRKTLVKEGQVIQSMIFGKVRQYDKKNLVDSAISRSEKYKDLELALRALMKIHNPNFRYTTIQINKSLKSPWHYDKGNVGMSYLIAFGKFKRGGTVVRLQDGKNVIYDNNHKWLYFDGHNAYHKTATSTGTRFAVVYYTKS
jgi:hypothetical protein